MVSVPASNVSGVNRVTVHAAGELDLLTASTLLTELTRLAQAGYRDVDLDLLGVTFCDGTGLTALLAGRREFARHGGRVLVHDPCWSLQKMLSVFDLTLALEPRGHHTSDDPAHL